MAQPHSNRPLRGGLLALCAAATWGSLPIAVQQVLKVVDSATLVWSRFVVAAVVIGLILARKLPNLRQMPLKIWGLIALGIFGLAGNFTLFAESLHYISPTTVQVLWQLAPFSMILCGVFLFKEPLTRFQKMGFVLLIAGLIAFFNDRFSEMMQLDAYAWGILLAASASLIWTLYGVAQKVLLKHFSSAQILLMMYGGCSLFLLPLASPSQLPALSGLPLICFIYCCLNTLIGYGAYGEALNHWDSAKVSVITTLLPIFTMVFSGLAHWLAPAIFPPLVMNSLSYLGAVGVVLGAILAATGDKLWRKA